MGKISQANLWKLLDPPPVGSAVKVGKMAATPDKVTATAIRRNVENGCWYYQSEEVDIRVWPNRFLEVPFGDGHLVWMGLEVKTDESEWKRKHLAFALEPYSHNWYGHGPFRPAAKTKAEAALAVQKAYQKTGDLLAALDAASYDPFETNRSWLTARLKNPMRLHWEGLEPLGDQFAFGRSVNYGYGVKGKDKAPHWLFAVCENYDAAVADLRLELQADYKLATRLPQEPAAIFDATLTASIHQALAGRADTGDRPNRVAYAAARIFTKHMEAAAKRSGAAQR